MSILMTDAEIDKLLGPCAEEVTRLARVHRLLVTRKMETEVLRRCIQDLQSTALQLRELVVTEGFSYDKNKHKNKQADILETIVGKWKAELEVNHD